MGHRRRRLGHQCVRRSRRARLLRPKVCSRPAILRAGLTSVSDERTWVRPAGGLAPLGAPHLLAVAFLIPRRPREEPGPRPSPWTGERTHLRDPAHLTSEPRSSRCSRASAPRRTTSTCSSLTIPPPTAPARCRSRGDGISDPHVRLVERPRRWGWPARTRGGVLAPRSVRATTWWSRWTPTCLTTPPSYRASSRRPPVAVIWSWASQSSRVAELLNWSRVRVTLYSPEAGNLYARLMLGIPLHDATSGYRVYRAGAPPGPHGQALRLGWLRIPDRAGLSRLGPRDRPSPRIRSRSESGNTDSRRSGGASWWRRSG